MGNRGSINNLRTTDRKTLYIILAIVIASVLTLTVVYAALSTTLNINGQAEISAANWDIYLDNVQLNNNSATTRKRFLGERIINSLKLSVEYSKIYFKDLAHYNFWFYLTRMLATVKNIFE